MFKNILGPVQAWLLSKGKCVGCGTLLSEGTYKKIANGEEQVVCKCGRVFIYDKETKKYRRALMSEV
ncbi:MAG: hypothetical protein M1120_02715 [Patescibacteria group bacterium]|nr:hypothetical protein [Patescibacteria group bacterium]